MIYRLETQSEMIQGRLNFGYLKYEKDSYFRLLALMIKRYSTYIISVAFLSICCTKYFMVKPPTVTEACEFHHVKNLSPIFIFYLTPNWIDNKLYFIGWKRGCEKDTLCLCTYDLKSKEWRFTDLRLDAPPFVFGRHVWPYHSYNMPSDTDRFFNLTRRTLPNLYDNGGSIKG